MRKILGLDVGDKWIGVAISDELLMTAQPLVTIERVSNKKTYEEIYEIILENKIETVVVGLPKNMNNTVGPQAEKVLKFSEKLKNKYKVEIIYIDERMTTLSAERVLIEGNVRRENRKKYVDKIAATYILQTHLDILRRNNAKATLY
ncbi:MAG: Holliday junction resolvase RuvX [Peptoniphilus sp.]|uniref:Holliday junction resolvase RuvX n=1 Tax=Peptoniphilus sp. TaxID=1971214 RepID=UPI002A759C05|nr:Holliday junction resolvase RuvX [Peptoniphilus sp.]MDY2987598.1 Holliday junction resolvase RuvX [Peptoniphilus sp.]